MTSPTVNTDADFLAWTRELLVTRIERVYGPAAAILLDDLLIIAAAVEEKYGEEAVPRYWRWVEGRSACPDVPQNKDGKRAVPVDPTPVRRWRETGNRAHLRKGAFDYLNRTSTVKGSPGRPAVTVDPIPYDELPEHLLDVVAQAAAGIARGYTIVDRRKGEASQVFAGREVGATGYYTVDGLANEGLLFLLSRPDLISDALSARSVRTVRVHIEDHILDLLRAERHRQNPDAVEDIDAWDVDAEDGRRIRRYIERDAA
jgi:hypothetical protein